MKGVIIFGKINVKMKPFALTWKETKHIHAPAADLLHTVFRIENPDSCKYQK